MASGQIYDMFDPTTVASNMYPFGTRLKVSHSKSGASAIVVVKDTGAFRFPIVIDLSQAAFAKLANPAVGLIDVLVEVLP
jgi:rare lipoprotein A